MSARKVVTCFLFPNRDFKLGFFISLNVVSMVALESSLVSPVSTVSVKSISALLIPLVYIHEISHPHVPGSPYVLGNVLNLYFRWNLQPRMMVSASKNSIFFCQEPEAWVYLNPQQKLHHLFTIKCCKTGLFLSWDVALQDSSFKWGVSHHGPHFGQPRTLTCVTSAPHSYQSTAQSQLLHNEQQMLSGQKQPQEVRSSQFPPPHPPTGHGPAGLPHLVSSSCFFKKFKSILSSFYLSSVRSVWITSSVIF